MKKFLFSLSLGILGIPIMAQDASSQSPSESLDFTANGITYTILNEAEKTCQTKAGRSYIDYDSRKIVFAYGNNNEGDVTIPAKVQKPVSDSSDPSGSDNTYTVVAIGSFSFDKATNITIEPGGVTTISESAFVGSSALTSISIPDDVTSIGAYAFSACSALTNVNLPANLTSISNNTFASSSITSIIIPENVTSIGDNAFSSCTALKSVKIPAAVRLLGKSAFRGCTSLASLTIEEGISSISSDAFYGCNSLTSLTIPASVTSIADRAFYCPSLTSITCLSKSLPAISSNSFSPTDYSDATLQVYKTVISNYRNSQLWGQFNTIEAIEVTPTGIVISPSTLNVNVGLTSKLTASLIPEDATGDISWAIVSTTPANCIDLDENGNVTARQIGTAIVSAASGDQTATCDIVISANPNESVVINAPSADIFIGDVITLSAVVFPTTITPSITWSSSNPEVASIDPQTGVLTAVGVGGTIITATNDDVSGTIAITINPIEATSVSLNQENITLKVGAKQTLTATILPDNTTFKNITWESNDPSVAIVSDGVVTAMGVGSANIRAMVGQATANCTVTVEPIEASSIDLSSNSETLKIGQSLQLSATVNPDNTTDKTVTWTSQNPDIATVSIQGEVVAMSQGSATITASCGNVTADCIINVIPVESEDVVLNYSTLSLKVGGSQQLSATIYPENTTDKNLTWQTSDARIVSVDGGLVTAIAVGQANVTVVNGSKSATCAVTVDPILVEQVILQESAITVNVGTPYSLTASILPQDATDQTIVWSSLDTSIATVSNGSVTGIAPGSTVITATSGNANASCSVTVLLPATSISLNTNSLDLLVGDMYDLIETVLPANTTDVVSWTSSDENVAQVDNNGIVSAIKSGTATITATCGNQTATCTVTVSDIAATSVILDASELNLVSGQSQQLVATVLPENTTYPVVSWESQDTKVATVSEDGTVTAVAAGTTTIYAICGEVKGECVVTVTDPKPEEVILNYTAYNLKAEETVQLEVINPANLSATDITWTSGNSKVASVSNEGLVTAISVGEAVITASYNNVSATCLITVNPTEAELVVLNTSEITMLLEEKYQLTATVYPETTTDDTVVWTSSNPEVASISEDGEIIALSEGVSTITAVCGNVYAVCLVTVNTSGSVFIDNIESDNFDGYYRVYNLQGVHIMTTKDKSDILNLSSGLYIINGQKIVIR